jgi:YHS domain-containing protein
MIRGLLVFLFVIAVYSAVKSVVRSAVRAYHKEDHQRSRLMGEEMVQDPRCRMYVPKGRAVTRRVNGKLCHFCSEACAKQFEESSRA